MVSTFVLWGSLAAIAVVCLVAYAASELEARGINIVWHGYSFSWRWPVEIRKR